MSTSGLSGEDLPSMWLGAIQSAGDPDRTKTEKKANWFLSLSLSLLELARFPSFALGHQNSRISRFGTPKFTLEAPRLSGSDLGLRIIPLASLVMRLLDLSHVTNM